MRLLSGLPLAALSTPALSACFTAGYYVLLIAVALRRPAAQLPTLGGAALLGQAFRLVPPGLAAGCLVTAFTIPIMLSRPPDQPQLTIAGSGGGTVALVQGSRRLAVLVDGGSQPASLQTMLGRHLPFWQRDLSALFVSEPNQANLGGLAGLTSLYGVGSEFDAGAVFPSVAYASWRAELRGAGLSRRRVRAGARVDFGEGVVVDVLEPAMLSVDDDPAPVAYRLRVGRLAVLLLNREAITAEPAQLVADGQCLDLLILPSGADVDSTLAVAQFLHPRAVILPQLAKNGTSPSAGQVRTVLPGARVWTATEGSELTLSASDGRCPVG